MTLTIFQSVIHFNTYQREGGNITFKGVSSSSVKFMPTPITWLECTRPIWFSEFEQVVPFFYHLQIIDVFKMFRTLKFSQIPIFSVTYLLKNFPFVNLSFELLLFPLTSLNAVYIDLGFTWCINNSFISNIKCSHYFYMYFIGYFHQ